ncbi:hypothetical protein DES53_10543 [Roseimicrobium gellanilyticum]|uniref:Uncharacterized protein n=1 Tax=Roseimicrobium gellanilyticum TaxID=748857 RepID=A0A366HNU0_9BACT|nr:hypothetical protein DES53_10543 [Roseimicrobium gellanilyticum]
MVWGTGDQNVPWTFLKERGHSCPCPKYANNADYFAATLAAICAVCLPW